MFSPVVSWHRHIQSPATVCLWIQVFLFWKVGKHWCLGVLKHCLENSSCPLWVDFFIAYFQVLPVFVSSVWTLCINCPSVAREEMSRVDYPASLITALESVMMILRLAAMFTEQGRDFCALKKLSSETRSSALVHALRVLAPTCSVGVFWQMSCSYSRAWISNGLQCIKGLIPATAGCPQLVQAAACTVACRIKPILKDILAVWLSSLI